MSIITKIKIKNFKSFIDFELELNKGINIIVGDNEAGKSTILEAIHLCLTGFFQGKLLRNDLTQYIFNKSVEENYLKNIRNGISELPPTIDIELFLSGAGTEKLIGDGNSEKSSNASILYRIEFDNDYQDEYDEIIGSRQLHNIPIEYYKVTWRTASRDTVTNRSIPLKSAFIDSSSTKFNNGSDVYVSRIIRDDLEPSEKASISQAYRELKEVFIKHSSIKGINDKLVEKSKISEKDIQISIDLSTKNAWESTLMTYLDNIPFHYIGKGEQCMIKTKLALSHSNISSSNVILIEEPENHLSHTKLNEFIMCLQNELVSKQLIVSTHSSFIANKLGLENLVLINDKKSMRLNELTLETQNFFKKLPGFQTLRLVLARKLILCEGPSDELIIQRAYLDQYNKLPIQDGIDVISVGLTFKRFLDIADLINKKVCVVTDNDGDYVNKIDKKYKKYEGHAYIKISADKRNDLNTLEPQVVDSNKEKLIEFTSIVGIESKNNTVEEISEYLIKNKTDWALKVFESDKCIIYPSYIQEVINWANE
ncbi:AAA family ATPase [Myroides sp. M-43]|uniref:ATP-dependent nuclease n=1 Tax=Myroides oncorhynchi TaxID=2893756 RepID=UPI001E2ED5FE|nr:AAA family ATPase [Myroides oncorhynchi]MCC9043882.1 AAA family ATPase [Myroides oncorhynchi]